MRGGLYFISFDAPACMSAASIGVWARLRVRQTAAWPGRHGRRGQGARDTGRAKKGCLRAHDT